MVDQLSPAKGFHGQGKNISRPTFHLEIVVYGDSLRVLEHEKWGFLTWSCKIILLHEKAVFLPLLSYKDKM